MVTSYTVGWGSEPKVCKWSIIPLDRFPLKDDQENRYTVQSTAWDQAKWIKTLQAPFRKTKNHTRTAWRQKTRHSFQAMQKKSSNILSCVATHWRSRRVHLFLLLHWWSQRHGCRHWWNLEGCSCLWCRCYCAAWRTLEGCKMVCGGRMSLEIFVY